MLLQIKTRKRWTFCQRGDMWWARGNYLTFLEEAPAESVATLSFPLLLSKGRK